MNEKAHNIELEICMKNCTSWINTLMTSVIVNKMAQGGLLNMNMVMMGCSTHLHQISRTRMR